LVCLWNPPQERGSPLMETLVGKNVIICRLMYYHIAVGPKLRH
jgi:hypothetical protein